MTISTRRLRASLPAVSAEKEHANRKEGESPYVVWLLVFLPVAFLFAFHFVSDMLARG